jgi:hypothetical protein
MDPKLSPAQADPDHDGDAVLLAPKDWTDAEEALSKLAHFASNPPPPRAGSDFSAGPRVAEPSLGAALRASDAEDDTLLTDRPRRTSRSFARFLVAACVGVAATLTWQSFGGAARQMVASAAPPLGWLLLPPEINPPPAGEVAVEQPNPPAVQVSVPQAASSGPVVSSETAAPTARIAPSAELQQQLDAMVHDLAAVRQSVERLAAGQEQMASDIAKLETAEQDIRRRISGLPPAAAAPTRKPVPPPQVAPQSSIAPAPPPPPPQVAPQLSAVPLPPAGPEPPRPPMPVR